MPLKSKPAAKRTVARKSTVPRGVKSRVVSIKRSFQGATISTAMGIASTVGSTAFNLTSLPAYTDFTALFDQYRLVKARIDFLPNITMNTQPGQFSLFHMCTDPTDVTIPANTNEVLQYDNHRTVQAYKPFSLTLKPTPSAAYYNTAASSGYGPKAGAWIDGKSPGVAHYGLKYSWDCNCSAVTAIVPYITLWCEFKDAN